ncbi:hypothetical protein GU926_13375 [Nibribacter ruber]|uniref:Uncharacterized protein n=1 Tax=Nibribacter ruber TaxID=2698458 RepID=A0A6P1P183_9BACT|nr:hypothetical protein [Nibribacter ruber]QHL88368.1 hypothetical protein GU926_13375 [Nibribacter ruber]
MQIREALKEVFRNFESPNYSDFKKIAAKEIWCLVCDAGIPPRPNSQRMTRRKFYSRKLKEIVDSGSWLRVRQLNDIRLQKENHPSSDISAILTILQPGEYAPGHEGASMAIHFKKIGGEFKFSGIETIP